MEQYDTLVGQIKYVTYQNSGTGFVVLKVKTDEGQVSVNGLELPTQVMADYKFAGHWREHPRYGKTFEAVSAEAVVKDTRDSVCGYLSCGIFKGIGRKLAERIYDHFGADTMHVVNEDVMRLTEVRGVSKTMAECVRKTLEESKYIQSLSTFLMQYGIPQSTILTLARKLGHKAESIIAADPYVMVRYTGLSFTECDRIALDMGIDPRSEVRYGAIISHAFAEFELDGDTGAEIQAFGRKCIELSAAASRKGLLTGVELEAEIISRVKDKRLHTVRISIDDSVRQYIFPDTHFQKERELAKMLVEFAGRRPEHIGRLEQKMKAFEEARGIVLDTIQREAVEAALTHSITVITGGPGTGKTTIMDEVVKLLEVEGRKSILLAPTGRAARKLEESTGTPAQTVHSLLGIYETDESSSGEDEELIENTTVICDEFSMVGSTLAWSLFRKLGRGSSIVIVGDPDQLQSVQPGAVLRDIITSGIIKTVKLEHIYRADDTGNLLDNIQKVNHGRTDLATGNDFRMYNAPDMNAARNWLLQLYSRRVEEYGIENTMLLVPFRKNVAGVDDLNREIQEMVNPGTFDKEEVTIGDRVFREGDFIMHILHNTPDASNGDLGVISKINNAGTRDYDIVAKINDKEIHYNRDNISELTLAYAMTVHKSQGSEAKAVITLLMNYHRPMLYRSMPYVAFSRAKEHVDVVCDTGLMTAIATEKANTRVTLLPYFLRYFAGEFVAV